MLKAKINRPLTVPEAAKILNYHPNHLGRLLREGRVEGARVGGRWMITHQEVERIKSLQGPGGRLPKRVPEQ
jgi:excisionase family DNA binding protein